MYIDVVDKYTHRLFTYINIQINKYSYMCVSARTHVCVSVFVCACGLEEIENKD